jgi:N-terminal domain of lipoyl synthase of Radical_SAM family
MTNIHCILLLAVSSRCGAFVEFGSRSSVATTNLYVLSEQIIESDPSILKNSIVDNNIPYVLQRGDGTMGGGGLIDKSSNESGETQLRRPKVGAEMPLGRPAWFKVPAPSQSAKSRYNEVKNSLRSLDLHTVCEEAQCPNIGECWNGGTGTIMLLGDTW